MNEEQAEIGKHSGGATPERFVQQQYDARFSVDGYSGAWIVGTIPISVDGYFSYGSTPKATPKGTPKGTPRETPARKSVEGETPRKSVSLTLAGFNRITPGRKNGKLGDEDDLQGSTYYEEVVGSHRTSNASPLCSPASISKALPFQNAEFDMGLACDVEAARYASIAEESNDYQELDADKPMKPAKAPLPICLKFVDVRYKLVLKQQVKWKRQVIVEKEILHGITGSVAAGEMLAVMGPSGSGKTTLLNILGGRSLGHANILTGTVTYNDQRQNKGFKRRTGFVTQDDVLYSYLTVRETLTYAALLRLPKSLTKLEKIERAETVIEQLRLIKCRDTIIGNAVVRGVSGGERKRVCIGHEILIDPSLILLDEPTSGLDSTTALHILQLLQNIAIQRSLTVVTTLHQPSSRMFHMFDKLILLSEGHAIYSGKAMDSMNYFSSIGFRPLIPMNPAEFLLDLCSGNSEDISQSLSVEKTKDRSTPKENGTQIAVLELLVQSCAELIANERQLLLAALCTHGDYQTGVVVKQEWTSTWWQQFQVLFARGFRERRHEYLSFLRIAQVLATAIICGLLWWQSKSETLLQLQDQVGLVFFFAVFWSFIPCASAVFTFPLERAILLKERASNMYRLSAYFMARTLGDLPLDLILPVAFVTIVYFMAHLRMTVAGFFLTMLTIFLIVLTSQSLGLFIGAAIMDVKRASTLSSVLIVAFMLTGGFFLQHIPGFISWMRYFSFHSYAYKLLIKVQYSPHQKYDCASQSGCQDVSLSKTLHGIRLGGGGEEVWALAIMIVGYRLLAYLSLLRMKI